jgi:hypothetical protein
MGTAVTSVIKLWSFIFLKNAVFWDVMSCGSCKKQTPWLSVRKHTIPTE